MVTGIPTTKNPIAIVAEGLPPIPTKLLEKIQRWEYIDLALLLHDTKSDELAGYQPSNQVLVFQSIEQLQRKKKSITDLQSWVQAFSVYAAALGGARSISYEQSVGLWAHQHLIVQLHKDLGATQAIKYDQDFREWAAAKGIKKWGDLNLPIYGRCLTIQQKSAYPTPSVLAPSSARLRREKREKSAIHSDSHSKRGTCFKWNFERSCTRVECRFAHDCYHCGGDHMAVDCSRPPKRPNPAKPVA